MQVSPGRGGAAVEADRLSYDAARDTISAEGNVLLSYDGVVIRADRIEFNQGTGQLNAVGSVTLKDQGGNIFEMNTLEVTGAMKEAFIDSLTITTSQGATVTARSVHFRSELATMLTEASYSPCGLCIDSKGRRVGWKVRAARIIYDREKAAVTLEQPALELLGIPVAWLPWFWVPDPTQPRATGLRMPSVDYSEARGAQLSVPFFVPMGEDIDLILSPTLMSRQGFLAHGDLTWRIPDYSGVVEVKASGLYQLDRTAFAGTVGDRDWRGAIQTSGRFTPIENWTAGWSYSVFTDNAYLKDYKLTDSDSSINQAYATHLTADTFIDARVQKFNRLGNYGPADEQRQGTVLPKVEFEHYQDLMPGWGRVHVQGEALSIQRGLDQTGTYGAGAVPYVFGYEGNKLHGMIEGAWENQYILPGGIAATPYLGARLDAASYDRSLPPIAGPYPTPADSVLFTATPIAAVDFRWPLMARDGLDSHLFEPVAQLVYRGSGTTNVGITNDDAQSFVFDTANLFSYNRFTGIDRQETGLRANIGGHYLGSFSDGSWLDLVAGQSFHLAGTNGLGIGDHTQVGTNSGLGGTSSFIVASARGGFSGGLSGGAKVQVDPSAWKITRAGVGVNYAPPTFFSVGADYLYVAAEPTKGADKDQHEVTGRASVTLADYYTVYGGLTYNIDGLTWAKAHTGLRYDDGYLGIGGKVDFTPTSWGFGVSLNLKGPDGQLAF